MKKNKKFEDGALFVSKALFKIIVWVLGAILIYWILLKITGHSPPSETVFMGAFGIIITLVTIMFGFVFNISRDIGEIKRFMKESDRRFYALARAFERFKHNSH